MSGRIACIMHSMKYLGFIRQTTGCFPVCLHTLNPARSVLGITACLQTNLYHARTFNSLTLAALAERKLATMDSVPLVCCRGMAGHSKWQNIKNIKSAKDSEKSKFSLHYTRKIKSIIKETGNADPKFNSRLASVIADAKSKNIPYSTIETAITQALKSKDSTQSMVYEGRGPGGCWFIIETITDKPTKTRNDLQGIFKKFGGLLGEPNSARHAFEHKGVIEVTVTEEKVDMDKYVEIAIVTGAEDVTLQVDEENNKYLEFYCEANDMNKVKKELEGQGLVVESTSDEYFPSLTMTPSEQEVELISRFLSKLEKDIPEVVRIHANVDSSVLS